MINTHVKIEWRKWLVKIYSIVFRIHLLGLILPSSFPQSLNLTLS